MREDNVPPLDPIEQMRVQAYMLLATLLRRPPTHDLLDRLGRVGGEGGDTPLERALTELASAGRVVSAEAAEKEFNRLFIGLQRGEVVPYASFYVTGFLHDRPLVLIRSELSALGVQRSPDVSEPEDHISVILETMAGLIDGRFGSISGMARQRAFFQRHIDNWAPRFFRDVEDAQSAVLYAPVGALGTALLDVERQAFALADA